YGKEPEIRSALGAHPILQQRARIVHTDYVIASNEKPSQAMRRGKGSSMWMALEAVKSGEAAAAVSGGNPGALMAMAKL
ncbi:phosphate acyltransferase, partial [Acinetobacter baumannii]